MEPSNQHPPANQASSAPADIPVPTRWCLQSPIPNLAVNHAVQKSRIPGCSEVLFQMENRTETPMECLFVTRSGQIAANGHACEISVPTWPFVLLPFHHFRHRYPSRTGTSSEKKEPKKEKKKRREKRQDEHDTPRDMMFWILSHPSHPRESTTRISRGGARGNCRSVCLSLNLRLKRD